MQAEKPGKHCWQTCLSLYEYTQETVHVNSNEQQVILNVISVLFFVFAEVKTGVKAMLGSVKCGCELRCSTANTPKRVQKHLPSILVGCAQSRKTINEEKTNSTRNNPQR